MLIRHILLAATTVAAIGAIAPRAQSASITSIVLVHGAFADGSGWKDVYEILEKDGYNVSIVQNPTETLEGDVVATRRVIDAQQGNVVLVGHSYGGAVITEAGSDPKVVGLVYVAAFAPDAGESVGDLNSKPAPDAPKPPILPPQEGFLSLDRAKFRDAFAADVKPSTADFMAASQIPWGLGAVTGKITRPAWKDKPSWYIVASQDKMIAPSLERWMASRANAHVTELAGSHAVFLSKPRAVAMVIEEAARKAGEAK